MDEEPEQEEQEPTVLRSGRVRIIGAEPAGKAVDPEAAAPAGQSSLPDVPPETPAWSDESDGTTVGTELPHWTEAPTGEVPAVLSREPDEAPDVAGDPWSSLPAPTWREEHTDWRADEETFEPSMLAHDEARLGSLDDSGTSDRQPWSFDLPSSGEVPAVSDKPIGDGSLDADDDTMVVPAVGRSHTDAPEEMSFLFDEVDETSALLPPAVRTGTTATPSGEVTPEAGDGDGGGDPPRGRIAGTDRAAGHDEDVPTDAHPPVRAVDQAAADGPERVVPLAPEEALVLEEPRWRRGVRGLGRSRRQQDRSAAVTGLDGDAGEGTSDDPPPVSGRRERPVPEAPPEPAGRSLPTTGRPVPKAPVEPRQPLSPPLPVGGLRPPEPVVDTGGGRNMPVAVVSGIVLGVITLVFFKLGTVTAMIVATTVVTLAAMEVFAAFRRAGYHPATLLGLVATVSLMVATYNKGQEALPLVLVLVFVFTMLWHLAGVDRAAEPVRSTASTLLVFCWVAVFGSFAALLLNPTLFPNRHGIAFLLGAVITAVAYDVGALVTGAWVGEHPLSEFSPNKTWEGVVGGAVAAIAVALVIVHFIHPWTIGSALTLGVVVAIVSPIGDLSESMVKRHLGLKDMGRILPGHGGLLDRIDGLLFVLPATYYLVKAFHLG